MRQAIRCAIVRLCFLECVRFKGGASLSLLRGVCLRPEGCVRGRRAVKVLRNSGRSRLSRSSGDLTTGFAAAVLFHNMERFHVYLG